VDCLAKSSSAVHFRCIYYFILDNIGATLLSYRDYNWICNSALKLPLSDVRLAQKFENSFTEICMSEYAKIGSLSELTSGEMKMVTLNGEDILLANVGGKIHAVSDLCSHAEASLSDGYIEDDEVECPLHGSRFSLTTGEALNLPADEPLKLYDVKVEGDDILVRVT